MGGLGVLTVPVELTERILTFCHPSDVAAFSRSCRIAYNIVYHGADQYLWRSLFLSHPFDDPRKFLQGGPDAHTISNPVSIDWKAKLLHRMTTEMNALNASASAIDKKLTLQTFVSVVQDAPPVTQSCEEKPSYDLQWLERVLRETRILEGAATPDEAQLHARLRSYLALSIDDGKDDKTRIRLRARRHRSRGFVYDLRNYNVHSHYGPYLRGGGVNWVHVEHLINVVLMNLCELPSAWAHTKPPIGLEATRLHSAPRPSTPSDWAGVEGTWRRYVCFMDYRDLFAFNYSDIGNGVRDPIFFDDPRFREATRLIEVKLHLISASELRFLDPDAPVNPSLDTSYPPLYFSGSSKGVNGNEAVVEGTARMEQDDSVRWQFVSIYDGHTQWSSDGVQVGNLASAMGVVGVWTTALHELGDPVGPFWLWKVEDDCPPHLMEYT